MDPLPQQSSPDKSWPEVALAVLCPVLLVALIGACVNLFLPIESLKPHVNEWALSKVVVYEQLAQQTDQRLFVFGDSTAAGFSLPFEETIQGRLEARYAAGELPLQPINVSLVASGYRDPYSVAGHFDLTAQDVVLLQINTAPELNENFYQVIYQTAADDRLPELIRPQRETPYTSEIERTVNCWFRDAFPLLALSEVYEDSVRSRLRGANRRAEGERRRSLWYGETPLPEDQQAAARREYAEPTTEERTHALELYREVARKLQTAFGDARVIVYLNPLNREYLEAEAGVDWESLRQWSQQLETVFRREGIEIANLAEFLPSEQFFDDNHPDAAGSERLAREFVRLIH